MIRWDRYDAIMPEQSKSVKALAKATENGNFAV
jgi:hypothetical protein